MTRKLLSFALLVCSAAGAQQEENHTPPALELRYSLTLVMDFSSRSSLRVPGAAQSSRLLAQPSFALSYRERVRASASLVGYASSSDAHAQARVREAFAGASLGNLDVTAGRRVVRWGSGYAFSATGVLDPPRDPADPGDRLSLQQGRDMVKADWVQGSHAVSVALARAAGSGRGDTVAARYNVLWHGLDTSVVVAGEEGRKALTGLTLTRVFGDSVGIHGEFAWRDAAAVLLGSKYVARSGMTVIAEFYSRPAGLRSPQAPAGTSGRQQYAFVRVGKTRLREAPGWSAWNVAGAVVTNIQDHSWIALLDVERGFGSRVSTYGRLEVPRGQRGGSEYGMMPFTTATSLGIRLHL